MYGEAKRRPTEAWTGDRQDEKRNILQIHHANSRPDRCWLYVATGVRAVNLRKFAQGKDCQLRIPGVCNFNPETTVLAHLRRGGVAGLGQKPPDLVGVHACSACHDCIDHRTPHTLNDLDTYILEGLVRTLAVVSKGE